MSVYNVLNWQNENTLANYPFNEGISPTGVIVDANFVQFDGFVPTLNYISVESDRLVFGLTLDFGKLSSAQILKNKYLTEDADKKVNLYTPTGDRFLGSLTVGVGALDLWKDYVGQKLTYDKPFISSTVKSVPLKDAVYTLDSLYGDVVLNRTSGDSTIFYNCVSTEEVSAVVFNAVAGHYAEPSKREGLRKINLVGPKDNNINLFSNDVIKFTSINNASLSIDLASGSPSSTFALPTL